MSEPSIKGSGIKRAVEDVQRLLEEGRVDRDELEARLAPEDLALFDRKILDGAWYPNESHRRLTELLRDVEGGGRDEYVVQRGRETAERLLEAGFYRALRLAESERGSDGAELVHAVRLMLTVSGALYSFGHWSLDGEDPDHLRIVARDAEALTDMNRLTAQGFIESFARRVSPQRELRVESRRLDRDTVEVSIRRLPRRA